jgi:hypothetical protein
MSFITLKVVKVVNDEDGRTWDEAAVRRILEQCRNTAHSRITALFQKFPEGLRTIL